MNSRLAAQSFRILFVLIGTLAGGMSSARAETGYLVYQTLAPWHYNSGPFPSYEAGADDGTADYQSHQLPFPGMEWQSCLSVSAPPPSGIGAWEPYLRYHLASGVQSGCFSGGFDVSPTTCPVGQLPQWFPPPTGGYGCGDTQPLACQGGRASDGTTCPTNCPAGLTTKYAGMCSAAAPAAKNIGPTCPSR
ncbi:MAG TPA: hypothetical protein VFV71_12750 [Burkholderiales bacterium]|nr:hypothetical protein [Burkholderiales bacterium]